MAFTNPITWLVGQLVTAAQLNQQLSDNLNAIWKGQAAGDTDYYASATTKTRLPIGSENNVLKVRSGVPAWNGGIGVDVMINTPQSIATNSDVEISAFQTEINDTDAFHSGSNGYATIPAGFDGYYSLTGYVVFDADAGLPLKRRSVALKVNAGIFARTDSLNDSDSNATSLTVATNRYMTAGETVKIVVNHRGTNGLNVAYARLTVIRIGD